MSVFRRCYEKISMFGLSFLQVHNHPMQVVIKSGSLPFAHPANLFQKIIFHNMALT